MTSPRLYSCWFPVPQGAAWPVEWYERHARVLEHSARRNSPGWDVDVRKIEPAPVRRAARAGNQSAYSYNTHKLIEWNRVVQEAPDGARLLVCDADLMVLRTLDPVWSLEFDVAITVKRGVTRLPLNGGVVFVRAGAAARKWFAAWLDWNMRLLADARLHGLYWKTYAGMNQAALGALIENGGGGLARVHELRCEEWNCESATWETYDASNPPRIVHVKGALRRGLMDPGHYPMSNTKRRAIATAWWALEKAAIAAAAVEKGARA